MKFLFENWKRYLKEGDVISIGEFPKGPDLPPSEVDKAVYQGDWADTPSPIDPELIDFVNRLEDAIGKKLQDVYGRGNLDIPIEKIEQLDNVMKELDALFELQDETGDEHGEN